MKILTVSDAVEPTLYDRFQPELFRDIELILSCGDLPPEYLAFLALNFDIPLLYVKGNHDIRYDGKPMMGCRDIHGRLVRIMGINILGLAGSRWYNGGPNQYTENEMKWTIWKLRPTLWLRGGIDVVIAHAPPRHLHDQEDRCHRGFHSFRWLMHKYAPRYFIHGHIHQIFSEPGERVTVFKKTRVVNTYGYCLLEVNDDQSTQ